jgi:hypothetical protein
MESGVISDYSKNITLHYKEFIAENHYPFTIHIYDIHYIYFLKHNNHLQLLHDDRLSSVSQLFKFFRCLPSASPAHENRIHGSILLHNYYFDTVISARQVNIILFLLFARLCYTVSHFTFTFAGLFKLS